MVGGSRSRSEAIPVRAIMNRVDLQERKHQMFPPVPKRADDRGVLAEACQNHQRWLLR
jgi:hypothetical protein